MGSSGVTWAAPEDGVGVEKQFSALHSVHSASKELPLELDLPARLKGRLSGGAFVVVFV